MTRRLLQRTSCAQSALEEASVNARMPPRTNPRLRQDNGDDLLEHVDEHAPGQRKMIDNRMTMLNLRACLDSDWIFLRFG